MRTTTIRVFALAAILMIPATSFAQMTWTDKAYASVNIGAQVGDHNLTTNSTFTLYDEEGVTSATQDVGGGAYFDLGGAYKVHRNLLVGVTYSHAGSSSDVPITSQVPDQIQFDHPRTVTATMADAKFSENAIHFSAVYMVPVTDKVDVGISAGPSLFMIRQDVPSAIAVTEPGPTVTSVTANKVNKTTGGLNLGVDVTYLFTKKIGGGLIARYTWGTVDIPDATDSLTVGGFQIGVGLRYRF